MTLIAVASASVLPASTPDARPSSSDPARFDAELASAQAEIDGAGSGPGSDPKAADVAEGEASPADTTQPAAVPTGESSTVTTEEGAAAAASPIVASPGFSPEITVLVNSAGPVPAAAVAPGDTDAPAGADPTIESSPSLAVAPETALTAVPAAATSSTPTVPETVGETAPVENTVPTVPAPTVASDPASSAVLVVNGEPNSPLVPGATVQPPVAAGAGTDDDSDSASAEAEDGSDDGPLVSVDVASALAETVVAAPATPIGSVPVAPSAEPAQTDPLASVATTSASGPMPSVVATDMSASAAPRADSVAATAAPAVTLPAGSDVAPDAGTLAPVPSPQPTAPASATARLDQPATVRTADIPLVTQLSRPILGLRSAGEGTHVLTISVTPENLGPVTVRAHIAGDAMRIELVAPTDQARDALKSIMTDLRRDLSAGGGQASLDLASSFADQSSRRETFADGRDSGRGTMPRDESAAAPRPRLIRSESMLDVLA